jgi:hypothetical protein
LSERRSDVVLRDGDRSWPFALDRCLSMKVAMSFFQLRLLPLFLVVFASACTSETKPPPPPSAEEGLKEMAGIYRYIEYSKLTLPRKPEDFSDYVDSMPSAFERVKRGDYVVAWGVGRSTSPGAAEQILVYEKKAPAEGGAVLLRDGTVKQMTATEFNAAPKAK